LPLRGYFTETGSVAAMSADRLRFTVTENGVVLVTPEMLGQEVHSIR
jgi:hypothetical protein